MGTWFERTAVVHSETMETMKNTMESVSKLLKAARECSKYNAEAKKARLTCLKVNSPEQMDSGIASSSMPMDTNNVGNLIRDKFRSQQKSLQVEGNIAKLSIKRDYKLTFKTNLNL